MIRLQLDVVVMFAAECLFCHVPADQTDTRSSLVLPLPQRLQFTGCAIGEAEPDEASRLIAIAPDFEDAVLVHADPGIIGSNGHFFLDQALRQD